MRLAICSAVLLGCTTAPTVIANRPKPLEHLDTVARAHRAWSERFAPSPAGLPRSIPDRAETAKVLALACEDGDASSCWRTVTLDHRMISRVEHRLESACDDGEVSACLSLTTARMNVLEPIPQDSLCTGQPCRDAEQSSCRRGFALACRRMMEDPGHGTDGRAFAKAILSTHCPEVEDACNLLIFEMTTGETRAMLVPLEWECRFESHPWTCSWFADASKELADDLVEGGKTDDAEATLAHLRDALESVCQISGECERLATFYAAKLFPEPSLGRGTLLKRWVCTYEHHARLCY